MGRSDSGWDIESVVLNVYDADGFLGLQTATEGSESVDGQPPKGGSHDREVLHPGGIYHSPLNAVLDKSGNVDHAQAAQAFTYREGGHVVVFPTTDPRIIPLLPTMNPGDTLVYGGAGAFYRVTGPGPNAGRHSMWTTDSGDTNGNTVATRCWPDRHQRSAPWGTETFDATGYHLALTSGQCFDMGGHGGSIVPPGYAGYGLLRADSFKIDAKTLLLGPTGDYDPVVLTTPLEGQLAAIVAAQQDTIQTLVATLDAVAIAAGTIAGGAATLAAAASTAGWATAIAGPSPTPAEAAFTLIGSGSTAIATACGLAVTPLETASQLVADVVETPNTTTHPLCSKSTAAT